MTYRGDDDAQRARIDELEQKLADANRQIATLRGEASATTEGTTIERSRLAGGPSRYVREVVLPFAISDAGYEAIATVLRSRLAMQPSQVGRALVVDDRRVPGTFSLTREGDATRIRLEGDWRASRLTVVAIGTLASGASAIPSAAALADILTHGLGWHHAYSVDVAISAAVIALGSTFALAATGWARAKTAKWTTAALAKYEGTFEAILAIAEANAIREDVAKTRVEAEADEGDVAEDVRATRASR
jgi:hypothetical protein